MPTCAIGVCKIRRGGATAGSKRFFHFPQDPKLAKRWITACRRSDSINLKNAVVCSRHFTADCIEVPLKYRLLGIQPQNMSVLKPGSIPTLHLSASDEPRRAVTESQRNRQKRMADKAAKARIEDILEEYNAGRQSPTKEELKAEIASLKANNNQIQASHQTLKSQFVAFEAQMQMELDNKVMQKVKELLAPVFTPGQISMIINKNDDERIEWCDEDYEAAMSLRDVSREAYQFLAQRGFPLPALNSPLRETAAEEWLEEDSEEAQRVAVNEESNDLYEETVYVMSSESDDIVYEYVNAVASCSQRQGDNIMASA